MIFDRKTVIILSTSYKIMNIYKKKSIFSFIKSFIFEQTFDQEYLPIVKQPFDQRIVRIYSDKSFISDQDIEKQKRLYKTWINIIFRLNHQGFDPTSNLILIWHAILALVILYLYYQNTIILIYGQIVIQDLLKTNAYIIIQIICVSVLTFDVFIQLNTGFVSNSSCIVSKKTKIIKRYIKYFSLIDLTLIMINGISLAINSYTLSCFKILIVLKFHRLFQLQKLYKRRLVLQKYKKFLYIMARQYFLIFFIAHTMGILYYAIDNSLLNTMCAGTNFNLCWLNESVAYSPIIQLDWPLRYFYSLYWGISITCNIPFGDIQGHNPIQQMYVTYMMYFGLVAMCIICESIVQALYIVHRADDQLNDQLRIIKSYMNQMDLSSQLQVQAKQNLKFLYLQQKNRDKETQNEIINKFPEDLKDQFIGNIYSQLKEDLIKIFLGFDQVTSFLHYIQEKIYTADNIVISQGQNVEKLYYMSKGCLSFQCEYGSSKFQIQFKRYLQKIYMFQEFIACKHSQLTMKTVQNSEFYIISHENIQKCVKQSQNLKQIYQILLNQVLKYHSIKTFDEQCYLCNGNHHWYHCKKHFVVYNQILTHQLAQKIQRKKERKIPKKYRTLCNKQKLRQIQQKSHEAQEQDYNQIKSRIQFLWHRIQFYKNSFQADILKQWSIFHPQYNFSRIQQSFNKRHIYKQSIK